MAKMGVPQGTQMPQGIAGIKVLRSGIRKFKVIPKTTESKSGSRSLSLFLYF